MVRCARCQHDIVGYDYPSHDDLCMGCLGDDAYDRHCEAEYEKEAEAYFQNQEWLKLLQKTGVIRL